MTWSPAAISIAQSEKKMLEGKGQGVRRGQIKWISYWSGKRKKSSKTGEWNKAKLYRKMMAMRITGTGGRFLLRRRERKGKTWRMNWFGVRKPVRSRKDRWWRKPKNLCNGEPDKRKLKGSRTSLLAKRAKPLGRSTRVSQWLAYSHSKRSQRPILKHSSSLPKRNLKGITSPNTPKLLSICLTLMIRECLQITN